MNSEQSPANGTTARELLEAVAAGRLTPAQAEARLHQLQIADLGFATLDLQRTVRRNRPEVVYAEGKTTEQVVAIMRRFRDNGLNALASRLTPEQQQAVQAEFPGPELVLSSQARMAHLVQVPPRRKAGLVGVLAAGTSDLPVAEEAAFTAEALGSPVERAYDVGVAGIHRLFRRADLLVRARVLVVVAGMEGALPSVVSGLVSCPTIAVPTSVGYGANFGGLAALLTMINSCSPGVSVLNIDNGFGAGYLADCINGIGEVEPPQQSSG